MQWSAAWARRRLRRRTICWLSLANSPAGRAIAFLVGADQVAEDVFAEALRSRPVEDLSAHLRMRIAPGSRGGPSSEEGEVVTAAIHGGTIACGGAEKHDAVAGSHR